MRIFRRTETARERKSQSTELKANAMKLKVKALMVDSHQREDKGEIIYEERESCGYDSDFQRTDTHDEMTCPSVIQLFLLG